jgi:very-short-patch-repair endonuclease
MQRARGRRLGVLTKALELNARGSAGTRSALEDRFLELVLANGLPEPEVNVMVEGYEVDFLSDRLVVEIDGPGHTRARARREDRERDARLRAAGHAVRRVDGGR